jgi:hypothetical protein
MGDGVVEEIVRFERRRGRPGEYLVVLGLGDFGGGAQRLVDLVAELFVSARARNATSRSDEIKKRKSFSEES